MKANELRDLSAEELAVRMDDLKKESFNLRFQLATGEIENPMRIREVRKTIAKIKTVLREKEMGR